MSSLLPFYHPTSVMVLDDDQNLLASFGEFFDADLPWHTFLHPQDAIAFACESERQYQIELRRCLGQLSADTSFDGNIRRSPHAAAGLPLLAANAGRFAHPTVLIVDYDMPAMNGVAVCRCLRSLPIRTVLLTGKAGMGTAIAAFNEGIIDRFYLKSEDNILDLLVKQIAELQVDYFTEINKALPLPNSDSFRFLTDETVGEYFAEILKHLNITEYYFSAHPSGFACFTNTGELLHLAIFDESWLDAQLEVALDMSAPLELTRLLSSRRVFAFFPTDTGLYEPGAQSNWRDHVWPVQSNRLGTDWMYSVVRGKDAASWSPAERLSYADFTLAADDGMQRFHRV